MKHKKIEAKHLLFDILHICNFYYNIIHCYIINLNLIILYYYCKRILVPNLLFLLL